MNGNSSNGKHLHLNKFNGIKRKFKNESNFNKRLKFMNGNNHNLGEGQHNGSISTFNESHIDIVRQRHSLPVYVTRGRLLKCMKSHETLVIIADTGCGKTTQIPQYIHEDRLDKTGGICITQPRRVAAISVAKRVAEEMNTKLGGLVGYSVRFEEAISPSTKLKFVTDGMLLREAMLDPLLKKYNWIILDEAHERTVCTDVLFSIVKSAQAKRKSSDFNNLHIIVMSATLNADRFCDYFNKAPILYIEGREHPIEMFYARNKDDDYTLSCMKTVFKIHRTAPAKQDILVFMTGQEEIDTVVRNIQIAAADDRLKDYPRMKVYPLYAALPSTQQLEVFSPSLEGERKVIVSTNIAETSLTIPGICYVVDSGRAKVRSHNSNSGFDTLKVEWISQAQAWQRTGRAGRITNGFCYRAYTFEEFNKMKVESVPEILRTNLSSVMLQILNVGVNNVFTFDFIEKPNRDNIKKSFESLDLLDAITVNGEEAELTTIGRKMSQFPLEPRYSKIILCSEQYKCTHEIITIVALLSSESVFVNPSGKKDEVTKVRSKFKSIKGDHITLLKIYRAFKSAKESKIWCQENFLSHRNLMYAANVRKQLRQICERSNIELASCQQDFEVVRRCLITGLFTNTAELQLDGKYMTLDGRKEVSIHPSSMLFGSKPDYILFTELVQTGKTYMHQNSSVDAQWLYEIAPEYFKNHHFRNGKT